MLSQDGILPLGYTKPLLRFLRGSDDHDEQIFLVSHLSAAGEVAAALSYVEEMEPSGTGGPRLEMLRIALEAAARMEPKVAIWHLETLKHLGTANDVDLQQLQVLKLSLAEIEKEKASSDRMEN